MNTMKAERYKFYINSKMPCSLAKSDSEAVKTVAVWSRCSISMSSLLTVPDFKDPGPTNLALLKCRGGQTQPRLLTHISIQATNLTSCLFDMIKHETSRADVKSWRSLSFKMWCWLLMFKSIEILPPPTLWTTRRGLWQSKLICKVGGCCQSVQMSTLGTFNFVVRHTLGKYRKH